MRLRLDLALALFLILQSICGVSLQDSEEFGAGLNDEISNEYVTDVPMVRENDLGESEDDPTTDGLAYESMVTSGLEDSQTTISAPNLTEDVGEEPSGSLDTNSTVTLPPMVRSEDYLDENDTVEENGPVNMTTASPELPLDPMGPKQNESLSVNNDTSLNNTSIVPKNNITEANSTEITSTEANSTVITSTEANSTEITSTEANSTVITSTEANSTVITSTEANSTVITSTEANSTVITSTEANSTVITSTEANSTVITSTEGNSTELISPTPETNRSDVTSPPFPGPQDWVTNATKVNYTDGLNPTTKNPPEAEPTTVSTTETPEDIPVDVTDTTVSPTETPEEIPDDVTDTIPTTTTPSANATAMGKAAGDNSERGLDSGSTQNNKNGTRAWGAILGTALVVGFVGLIIYVLLKRKGHREFSHTKLVEETSSDPVLRLDNSEPLDMKFDGFGYYNPALQGDDIQMNNFPAGP